MRYLVTGAGGFIGFFLSKTLLDGGNDVVGVDNLNDYYDVNLKKSRLEILQKYDCFAFCHLDISDRERTSALFSKMHFDIVVNFAAQAGVRYSIDNPNAYIDSNLVGFANILEGCRHSQPSHLIYASSSSVYGMNKKVPFSTEDNVDHPISLYAATKKSNELLAYSYSHLYNLPVTGLRFFTVYGPWGRPDMAYFKFTKAILEGRPIDVYNYGNMKRDFTYVDDIVQGIVELVGRPPKIKLPSKRVLNDTDSLFDAEFPTSSNDLLGSNAPYALYNIGNNTSVELNEFIETLEALLNKKAIKNMLPMQPGDVPATYADIEPLTLETGFKPSTSIKEGLEKFVLWYKEYYG